MAIRRKDGSIYRLRGPNKLLVSQNFWNHDEHFVLHNFDRLTSIVAWEPPKPVLKPAPLPLTMKKKDEVFDSAALEKIIESVSGNPQIVIEEPKTTLPIQPPTPEPLKAEPEPEPVVSEEPTQKSPHRNSKRHMLFCLPANVSESRDDLYDESYVRIDYKDPFRFQAAFVQDNDIKTIYWTTVQQATNRSIVFHPDRRRWWRVSEIVPCSSGDGVLLGCIPSDIKPDFSSVLPS